VFIYQAEQRYFAQVAGGLEEIARAELAALGARAIRDGYRGFHFEADPATLYRVNYCARLVARVLAPLTTFRCHHEDYLYRRVREVDWTLFVRPEQTFAVFANVSDSNVTHSRYAALRIKDAIADQQRDLHGRRPSVDTKHPDLWVHLHLSRNQAILSVDASGGALHRRGYRRDTVEAPILETLAAAIIDFSEWDGSGPLYDPMCGSGTLLAEAWIKGLRIPPGMLRSRFGFECLPDFDRALWREVKKSADAGIRQPEDGRVAGSDVDPEAVHAARTNADRLPHAQQIRIGQQDFRDIRSLENHTIICNPPYGIRLKRGEDLGGFYQELGDFLKQRCQGSDAVIYFGEREMIKRIGLRPTWKKPLRNGGLDGRLVKYALY
jgi:putative N6-adenine-specific DNA methylase